MFKPAPTSSNWPVYAAAALGLVAIGTLAYLQNRPPRVELRVLTQTVREQKRSSGRDLFGEQAISVSPPYIEVRYTIPRTDSKQQEYRVRPMCDAGGLEELSQTDVDQFRIPFGYATPPAHPRLEVWQDDRVIATAPLAPFPPSTRRALGAKPDARLRAVANSGIAPVVMSKLRFEARKPIAKDERWTISLRRSDLLDGPLGEAALDPYSSVSSTVMLPWAADAREAEIQVTRIRKRTVYHDYRLEGLQLVDHNGATALRIPHDFRFVDRADDFELLVPKGEIGPPRPTRAPDQRVPTAKLQVHSTRGREEPRSAPGTRRRDGRVEYLRASIVSPKPETLNVRMITLGGTLNTDKWPRDPVVRKPFTAIVRVTMGWDEPIKGFRAVLPIEVEKAASRAPANPTSP